MRQFVRVASSVAIICATTAIAKADYVRIGKGPSLDYAEAYCSNESMGVHRGFVAFGSNEFVAGAAIGSAIGNAVRQWKFKKNCMIMNGWKYVSHTETKRKTVFASSTTTAKKKTKRKSIFGN